MSRHSDPNSPMPSPNETVRAAPARVLVVDDHAVVRNGVASILNQEADFAVCGEAGDGATAVRRFHELRPDVTLIDLRMPGMDGIDAVRAIRAIDPAARVIVLTMYDTDDDIEQALQAGAQAYLLKDVSAAGLVAGIRDVLAGRTHVGPAVAAKLAQQVTRVRLTAREVAVLRLLAHGSTNREIAERLGVTEGTIKIHLNHLFQKLDVSTRTEAVNVGVRRGLVRLT